MQCMVEFNHAIVIAGQCSTNGETMQHDTKNEKKKYRILVFW